MNLRMASGVIAFTILAACGGGSPPAESPKPAEAAPASAGSAESGDCASQTIKSKADFDSCRQKCNDQGRDLGRTCNDPNCLAGIGQSTRQCLGRCEDGQKTSQQKHCYKE
jgi:hypothetical protein